jgi:hypothetical protein
MEEMESIGNGEDLNSRKCTVVFLLLEKRSAKYYGRFHARKHDLLF